MSVTAPGAGSGLAGVGPAALGVAEATASEAATVATAVRTLASGLATELTAGLPTADSVVIRTPGAGTFATLAMTGLRQLGTLLPVLERQLVSDAAPAPLGHLARAVGDAAYRVGAGFTGQAAATLDGTALSARPTVLARTDGSGAVAAAGVGPSPAATRGGGPGPGSSPGLDGKATEALARATGVNGEAGPAVMAARSEPGPMRLSPLVPQARQGETGRASVSMPTESLPDIDPTRGTGREAPGRPFALAEPAGASFDGLPRTDGHPANEPGLPQDAAAAWQGLARQTLQKASIVLDQVSQRLQPMAALPTPASDPVVPAGSDLAWAMLQVAGAQRQVAASVTLLAATTPGRRSAPKRASGQAAESTPIRWGPEGQFGGLIGALAVAGTMLLAGLLAVTAGAWTLGLSALGLGLGLVTAAVWGWRVVIGARGLRIVLQRPG